PARRCRPPMPPERARAERAATRRRRAPSRRSRRRNRRPSVRSGTRAPASARAGEASAEEAATPRSAGACTRRRSRWRTPRPARGRPRSLEREVRLDGERRDSHARQVATPLVDHEALLPGREELPVEEQQVVELEPRLHATECRSLEALREAELCLRREQRCEGREVQRDV